MTYEEVNTMIQSIGLPSAYFQWYENNVPNLPYVVFYFPNSDNFSADNIVYKKIETINVELYTKNKDFAIEQQVEAVFEQNGFFWNKFESYLDDEDMYEVMYQFEISIDE